MAPFARVAPPTDARRGARVAYIVQDLSDSHGAGYGVRQATTRRARAARSAPAAQSCATKLQAGSKAVGRDVVRILFSWFGRLARSIRGRPHVLGRAPCAGSKIAVVVARQAAENDLLEQANLPDKVLDKVSSLFSSSATPVGGRARPPEFIRGDR